MTSYPTHEPLNVVTIQYLVSTKKRPLESGLLVLDRHETLENALRKLSGYKILSAPVRFENRYKIFSLMDALVALIGSSTSLQSTVGDLCELSASGEYATIESSDTILQGIDALVKNQVHRIIVVRDGIPSDILSQMDIVVWLVKNYDQIPSSLRTSTLGQLKSLHMFTCSDSEPILDAFKRMIEKKVSGLAVVNQEGSLVAHLGASDLRGIMPDKFQHLFRHSVDHFLQETKHYLMKPPITVSTEDSFENALKLMQQNHVHRVFVLDQHQKLVGAFSTTDVCCYLMVAFSTQQG